MAGRERIHTPVAWTSGQPALGRRYCHLRGRLMLTNVFSSGRICITVVWLS